MDHFVNDAAGRCGSVLFPCCCCERCFCSDLIRYDMISLRVLVLSQDNRKWLTGPIYLLIEQTLRVRSMVKRGSDRNGRGDERTCAFCSSEWASVAATSGSGQRTNNREQRTSVFLLITATTRLFMLYICPETRLAAEAEAEAEAEAARIMISARRAPGLCRCKAASLSLRSYCNRVLSFLEEANEKRRRRTAV